MVVARLITFDVRHAGVVDVKNTVQDLVEFRGYTEVFVN